VAQDACLSSASLFLVTKDVAQHSLNAALHVVFEQSGCNFDYPQSLLAPLPYSEQRIAAYLSRIQRGNHIWPFGRTLVAHLLCSCGLCPCRGAPPRARPGRGRGFLDGRLDE
jgi:hypothetical protein